MNGLVALICFMEWPEDSALIDGLVEGFDGEVGIIDELPSRGIDKPRLTTKEEPHAARALILINGHKISLATFVSSNSSDTELRYWINHSSNELIKQRYEGIHESSQNLTFSPLPKLKEAQF